MSIGKKDTLGIMKGLVDKMPNYSRSVDSWEKLSTYILQALEIFINYVRKQFGADNISLLKTGIQAVDSWCTRVMAVLNESQTGGDIMNPDSVHLLCALRDEGSSLTNMYRFAKDVSPILHRYLGMLDELCRVCSAAMHSFKGGRPQPVVMALTGEPGVGKTFLCKMITSLVLKGIITAEHAQRLNYNFDSEVFMKGTTEYWNGYSGQMAVVVDDWGQTVPVPGGENDFIDLIRMANCWSYPLNFADVDNKGKNFFKSSFLLLTTNAKNIDYCQRVILEPEAVSRRIDHGYEITVSPEYVLNGKLNFQKVIEEMEETKKFPYHAWKLYKYRFAVGSEAGRTENVPIALDEAIEAASGAIRRNRGMFENNSEMVSTMLKQHYGVSAQGGTFEQFLEIGKKVYSNLTIPTLRFQLDALRQVGKSVKEHFSSLMEELSTNGTQTVITLIVGITSTVLIFGALKMAIQTIFSWFKKSTKTFSKVKNALRKKVMIPDPILAQAIESLRKEDFQTAELQGDGTYDLCLRFTPEVLKKAYERLTSTTLQSNEPQNYKLKYTHVKGSRVIESDVEMQGDLYGNSMSDTCARNLFSLRIVTDLGTQKLGHVMMVRGGLGIFPEHFIDIIERGLNEDFSSKDSIVVQNLKDHTYVIKYKIEDFLNFKRVACEGRDCVMIKFESMRASRDVTSFFVTEKDLTHLHDIRLRLDSLEGKEELIHRSRFLKARRSHKLEYAGVHGSRKIFENYEYEGFTSYGDCGSLATLQDYPSLGCRRILGIHVAGSAKSGIGFTSIIHAGHIDEMLKHFDEPQEIFPQAESYLTLAEPVSVGSFTGLNYADKTYNMNPSSSLIKTPMYGLWGDLKKKPAPLAPFLSKETGEIIKPMVKAVEGYASPVLHFEKEKVAKAAYHAFAPLRSLTKEHSRRIVSFEEAVAGVPDTNINGIPRGTSPGYPYVLDGVTSKKPFFGGSEEYTFDNEKALAVRERVDAILENARSNIRLPHVYVDFLKDELRPTAKALSGQSRLISAAPMDYVIAFRMMFLSFTSAVQNTRIRNGVGVGINHFTEWDLLAKRLQSKGKRCVAGDFKGFDKEEQPAIHWAIVDQINAWYDDGPENARIRRVLWLEVVHSRHFGGLDGKADRFYQWNKSLSSGHPATSIINSFYGLILFNLVWADIVGPVMASEFWEHVYVCTYGDDNVLNIDEDFTDVFNQDTIASGMKRYGMTYTNENKDGDVAPTRELTDISFLKRGFRFEKRLTRWVGPLDLDSILYTAYWARSKTGIKQNVADNLEFSWSELALHESSAWMEHADQLRVKFSEVMGGEPKHYFTRNNYQDIAMSMVPAWEK
uniref:RNA-directed RNA polymerase n=1 Tax=Riboviria sp. TaxID=2585031 RepID=A0A893A7D8_9VIRU|nr:MAG: hypothetical protein 1 [Riboviria sp.]